MTTPLEADPRVVAGTRRLLDERTRALRSGAIPVGWKIGLNDPVVRERLGLSRELVGYLTEATRLPGDRRHSLGGSTRVGLEPEIAVRVGADVPARANAAVAASAVAEVAPAFELLDLSSPTADVEEILAGNCFHRAFRIGEAAPEPLPAWLPKARVRLYRDGRTEREAACTDVLEDPVRLVRLVADTLADAAGALRAGDWILTGGLAPLLFVRPGDRVAVEFDGLERLEVAFGP